MSPLGCKPTLPPRKPQLWTCFSQPRLPIQSQSPSHSLGITEPTNTTSGKHPRTSPVHALPRPLHSSVRILRNATIPKMTPNKQNMPATALTKRIPRLPVTPAPAEGLIVSNSGRTNQPRRLQMGLATAQIVVGFASTTGKPSSPKKRSRRTCYLAGRPVSAFHASGQTACASFRAW